MPATYQKKYYYQFTSLDGKVNVVELWQYTADTLVAEEVEGTAMPFSIEMPELDHKFQVVRGTGCEINLLSSTDRKFFAGLYHTDMKEFIIKHYIDTVINWIGYLNAELVREGYSELMNYPFQITGNDGFALLDRLHFYDVSGATPVAYTGIKSMFDLLQIALNSIGLPYANLYISLSTTFAEQGTASESTILHETFVDAANFYNEDNEPETMRKVIESVLAPFGGVITQIGGDIWITDVNTIGTGTGIFKKFTQSTGVYVEAVMVDLVKDIGDIGYMGTGSDIEMSGGKNKQVVCYSPYPIKTLLQETLVNTSEADTIPIIVPWTLDAYRGVYYKTMNNHVLIETFSPAQIELSYKFLNEEEKQASVCLAWSCPGTASAVVASLKINPSVALTNEVDKWLSDQKTNRGVKLKVSGEIYFNTNNNLFWGISLKTLVRVGDKSVIDTGEFLLSQEETTWGTYPASPQKYHYISIIKEDKSKINDQWIPFEYYVPHLIDVNDNLSGDFYFDIYSDYQFIRVGTNSKWTNQTTYNNNVRIRKLAVSIVDIDSWEEVGDQDKEYIGYLDPKVKEEAEKVTLLCGTDQTCCDRGKIMYNDGTDYLPITTFTRFAQTFKIEELLLNSLSSNYRFGYLTLSNLKLENDLHQFNAITDEDFINDPVKRFMVSGININFRDNLAETTLTEITPDALTIVK